MQAAGLSIHQQRICQPYGDDQRKGLWLYQIIEPETWGKVLARVNGANSGALYAQDTGNILGRIKITLPEGHTWESFSNLLLATMPPKFADHYKDKIATFIHWYEIRGYPDGIPDSGPLDKSSPSWRRVAKALLRQDYWNKGLGFSQTRSDAYDRYKKMMKGRRERWGIYS
jgi:predicted phosphoadenosine phosphosulfate sulfurtransferase